MFFYQLDMIFYKNDSEYHYLHKIILRVNQEKLRAMIESK